MAIDLSALVNESDVNINRLKNQVEACRIPDKAYALYLLDKEKRAMTAVLQLTSENEGEIQRRNPLHGINDHPPNEPDTYQNLVKIMNEGFISRSPKGLNATIYAQDIRIILARIANKTEYSPYADPSTDSRYLGDRYFLEFRRFLTSPLIWREKKPENLYAGSTPIMVSRANIQDIKVNVILGTAEQKKIGDRIENYRGLFQSRGIDAEFFAQTRS